MTANRLKGALASYAVLALVSIAVLEGEFLGVILILFAGLAFKSWVGFKREQIEAEERREVGASQDESEEP